MSPARRSNPGGVGATRPHHFGFAHTVIRDIAFENPMGFVARLAEPDARNLLLEVWNQVGAVVSEGGEAEVLAADGLEVEVIDLRGRPCVVVDLPAPSGRAECFFVAVVMHQMPTEDQVAGEAPSPAISYYTLELGEAAGGAAETVLCEWSSDAHRHLRSVPDPERETFVEAVADDVEARLGAA